MTVAKRLLVIWCATLLLAALPISAAPVAAASPGASPIPILAYYYIWYDTTSWNRAKSDYPVLGRYSSDDINVMRQQVLWAKQAGIDGFIVSWKSTVTLDRRLEQLIQVADEESFKLVIMYQGLDFNRNPLPVDQVANDLEYFIENYASDPAFDILGGPVFIWSGTWAFSLEDVMYVAQTRMRAACGTGTDFTRPCVELLASERNVDGINRLGGVVDGDAYYWSSVNPDTYKGYADKLVAMRDAVKATGGLWIAPAAPGFDARLIGGTTVVPRNGGDTLRRELNAAYGSSPDAIGLISWNEFSENSQVEPSVNYGNTALSVIADVANGTPPQITEFDSSQPAPGVPTSPGEDMVGRILALALIIGLLVVSGFVIARRRRTGRLAPERPPAAPNPFSRRGRQ